MLGVSRALALEQSTALEHTLVIRQTADAGEVDGGEDGLVDLFGVPVADLCADVKKDFEQGDDTWIVDFDVRVIIVRPTCALRFVSSNPTAYVWPTLEPDVRSSAFWPDLDPMAGISRAWVALSRWFVVTGLGVQG